MENNLLQMTLEIIIQVLLPVVLTAAVGYLVKQFQLVSAKIPQEQYAFAMEMAKQLVLAAEQNGLSGAIANESETKKQYVLTRLQSALAEKKINIDVTKLSDLIEAAVMEAFNYHKVF